MTKAKACEEMIMFERPAENRSDQLPWMCEVPDERILTEFKKALESCMKSDMKSS
jgi:hypothetical protein